METEAAATPGVDRWLRRRGANAAQKPLHSQLCKLLNLRGHKIHCSAAHKQRVFGQVSFNLVNGEIGIYQQRL
jgi:hypothetical protein